MNRKIIKRNNVHVVGKGSQPIIFASGFGCSQKMWRYVAPAFEEDYRVILFDYVGSGASDQSAYDPARYGTLAGYAQDVVDVCTALDVTNAILVGHSVGSIIGLLASIQEPAFFNRLVMIAPSPRYLNDPPDYFGGFERNDIESLFELMESNYISWAGTLSSLIMQNPSRPYLAQELEESFCAVQPRIANQFARATFLSDHREDLAKARVPSLILQCDQDRIAPMDVGLYMHRHMPHSQLEFMMATGHCPHISHPEETVQWIQRYLKL